MAPIPKHQKKKPPIILAASTPVLLVAAAPAPVPLPVGMVHVWVAQNVLNHYILRVFTMFDLLNI